MSGKFFRRTLRNVVFRNRPYFAHLAFTHRCNLRCRFCHIQETKFAELDTAGMKRVIDVLDRLGVAVLSVSGGGEPLLREDFAEILEYAVSRGLYTKITSNGTMPLERYQRLLQTGVKEIAISLDGVDGNDLPFSHVGPKILATIRYLNDHLPPGMQLTVNVTVTEANCGQVSGIIAYCEREFPNAKVWLNPVVVGTGKLRTSSQAKVSPGHLEHGDLPTLLSARFYNRGVQEQYRSAAYDWGCKAGRMFFDVKPNGDLWLCQDQPSRTPLNVLDPDFPRQLRQADSSYRRECSGCTYSCYFVTQKGFEFRNWPDMAGLWWKANTHPDERCRQVAARQGWVAGLLSFCATRLRRTAAEAASVAALALLLLAPGVLRGQPAPAALDSEEVVLRMEQSNASQQQALVRYESVRTYLAENSRLHRQAQVTAEFRFDAPASRDFRITERSGSRAIQRFVLEPLLATERKTGKPAARRNVDITRHNYSFTFAGFDENARAYVFEVHPRTANKYLFRGRIWIDGETYRIRRIEGEPARAPSFWVRRVRFVHEYDRFGDFWFPVRHQSVAELRLFGRSTLSIGYTGYRWEAAP